MKELMMKEYVIMYMFHCWRTSLSRDRAAFLHMSLWAHMGKEGIAGNILNIFNDGETYKWGPHGWPKKGQHVGHKRETEVDDWIFPESGYIESRLS